MSGNSTNQKYATRFAEGPESAATVDDSTEDLGAFGLLRDRTDRAEMLELRKKTGNIRAIAYSWIQKVDFDPSAGITLYAGDEMITLKGRNLNASTCLQASLLGGILCHRVPWICQSDQATALKAGADVVLVDQMDW